MACGKYFMFMLQTFKEIRGHVLKRHYDSLDSSKDRFI